MIIHMWTDVENACIKVPFQKQKVLTNHFNVYVFFKKKLRKRTWGTFSSEV